MKRFLIGLLGGVVSGGGAYFLGMTKGDAVAAVIVGLIVAAVIWFSAVGDVLADCLEIFGSLLLRALAAVFRELG